MFAVILLTLAAREPVIDCGPAAAVAGVVGAWAAHRKGVVPPFDGQFYDPVPPAAWPAAPTREGR